MLCVCQGNSFTGMFVELAGQGFLWVTQGVMILTSSLKSALIAGHFVNLFGAYQVAWREDPYMGGKWKGGEVSRRRIKS